MIRFIAAACGLTLISLVIALHADEDRLEAPAFTMTETPVETGGHASSSSHEPGIAIGATFEWACHELVGERRWSGSPNERCMVTAIADGAISYRCAGDDGRVVERHDAIPVARDTRREVFTRWADNTEFVGCGPAWDIDETWTNGDVTCRRTSGGYSGAGSSAYTTCASATRGIVGITVDGTKGGYACGAIPPIIKRPTVETRTHWTHSTNGGC